MGKGKLDGVVPVTDLLKKCAEEGPPAADLLIACATRAGDEPGYRKTNQDSYAVHEKFASTAGSFFAVFDGHGPNGEEGRTCVQCSAHTRRRRRDERISFPLVVPPSCVHMYVNVHSHAHPARAFSHPPKKTSSSKKSLLTLSSPEKNKIE